jgi:hypothetical protein
MMNYLKKYSTLAIIFLPIILFILMVLYPFLSVALGIICFLFGVIVISYSICKTNRESYLQGKISRLIFFRNSLIEIIGFLLALILAALIGKYLAVLGTRQIDHENARLLAGLVIGLLAGAVIGALVKGVSNRMVRN